MSEKTPNWISDWNPEDATYWKTKGSAIARRNLIWSIVAEHIGFSVWLIWSIVATKLPAAGFHYTTDELFQLVAIPGLIGSVSRALDRPRCRPRTACRPRSTVDGTISCSTAHLNMRRMRFVRWFTTPRASPTCGPYAGCS